METLEDLIRRYVILGKPSAKGFHGVKCQVCNDYKERGGFKFDGDAVGFLCFNCNTKGKFDPSDQGSKLKLSGVMLNILTSFGIPEDEIQKAVGSYFFKEKINKPPLEKKSLSFPSHEISFPKSTYSIVTNESPWCEVARTYLEGRAIDPTAISFFVSEDESYLGRVIIPYYFRDKLIYWQGRSMDPAIMPRYKNPSVNKDNVFFNMDEIYRYTNDPLFVTEGPLDAISIGTNAVAILGSVLSEFKMRELKKAALKRRVIFVIDKNRNGYQLGNSVLTDDAPNFYVSVLPDNVEDANDGIIKLGRLFVVAHLASTAANSVTGKVILEMKCSKMKK